MQRIKEKKYVLYLRLLSLKAYYRACLALRKCICRKERAGLINAQTAANLIVQSAKLMKYLNITAAEFVALLKKWRDYSRLIGEFSDSQEFYLSWTGEMGKSNLCANIVNQVVVYEEIFDYLTEYLRGRNLVCCDYGCGAATFSFLLHEELQFVSLHLYDVENAAAEFVRWTINVDGIPEALWFNVMKTEVQYETYDLLVCLDVLEHLKNSSEVFSRIGKMLKLNGFLVLRAPWGNHVEHIPEAAIDFYEGGGYKSLKRCFKRVHHFGGEHINGVYRKVR